MSDAITAPTPTPNAAPSGAAPTASPSGIDIDRLAEKVYRLMCADLRQEQARRGGKR